ncbi:hypothetical protein KSF73_15635 [Burkholderiaceae bacterium DAT-1]|nr:hypothetical protein [Burkholderiaceae bacterium DAT-1]
MKRLMACIPAAAIMLGGCATPRVPTGPTVAVMPAPGKPYEVFQDEERQCRSNALSAANGMQNSGADEKVAASMIAGAALGAAAGALIGDNHQSAGAGAGVGMLMGAVSGGSSISQSNHDAQWQYNNTYKQCMYAKGNQVPGYAAPALPPPPPPAGPAPKPPATPQ